MMSIIRIIKGLGIGSLIFTFFVVAASGMFFLYTHNSNKLKQLKLEMARMVESNQGLLAQQKELYSQLDTQAKKSRELTTELLKLSEEKTNCYKTIIKYHEKLKKVSIHSPARVELLVNNYFSRMFSDVARATGDK
jgi:septal ring factor EnvC (AmiA/AmiB activator)